MKKRIALFAAVILIVALTACAFITVQKQDAIIVRASMLNTAKALSQPALWQKWQPALAAAYTSGDTGKIMVDSATSSFTIQSAQAGIHVFTQGLVFNIDETGNRAGNYTYSIVPSLRQDSTQIVIVTRQSLLRNIFAPANSAAVNAADSLKSFLETPAKFYGFPIEKTGVLDTNVAIIHTFLLRKDRLTQLNAVYNRLDAYVKANHLTALSFINHFADKGADSLDLMTGMPVVGMAAPKDGIYWVQMPKGTTVIVHYKGTYAGRFAAYNAMNAYIRDHFLQVAASNYEKYPLGKLPQNDSSQIEMKLYWPVY